MRFKKIFLATVCLAICAGNVAADTSDREILRVVRGQSRIEPMPGISQIAIGDGRIADVKVVSRNNELMLTGLREGMTTLSVWQKGSKKHFLVRVLAEDPRLVADDLQEITNDIPGVVVKTVGERVLMTGRVLNSTDFAKIAEIAKLYPDVLNFVEPNHVDMDQLIRLNVNLVEIDRSKASEIGFSWPDSVGLSADVNMLGDLSPGVGPFDGTIALTSQLAAALKLFASNGYGRTLANPTLVTKNGKEATFHAGGQIPVPVNTGLGQTSVSWKSFGVQLQILPHVDLQGNFNLELEISVSDIDRGNAVETDAGVIPAMKSRTTKSQVNLSRGESLVVAELVDRRQGKVVGKMPGLGHIPIIGELFRSRAVSNREQEVYIIITPSLLRPGSLPTDEVIEKQQRYQDAEDEISGRVLD